MQRNNTIHISRIIWYRNSLDEIYIATGQDQIQGELFNLLENIQLDVSTESFNRSYETSQIPKDLLVNIFTASQKCASRCEDHRIISLMRHALKVFLRILQARIFKNMEENISHIHFGYRNSLRTREALFAIQILIEQARYVNCDVVAPFIVWNRN